MQDYLRNIHTWGLNCLHPRGYAVDPDTEAGVSLDHLEPETGDPSRGRGRRGWKDPETKQGVLRKGTAPATASGMCWVGRSAGECTRGDSKLTKVFGELVMQDHGIMNTGGLITSFSLPMPPLIRLQNKNNGTRLPQIWGLNNTGSAGSNAWHMACVIFIYFFRVGKEWQTTQPAQIK